MERDQQHVRARREPQQCRAQHPVRAQIERRCGFLARELLGACNARVFRLVAQVDVRKLDGARAPHDLHAVAVVVGSVDRAQHFMPLEQRVERSLERAHVQIAVEMQRDGHVVLPARGFDPLQHPQALLRERRMAHVPVRIDAETFEQVENPALVRLQVELEIFRQAVAAKRDLQVAVDAVEFDAAIVQVDEGIQQIHRMSSSFSVSSRGDGRRGVCATGAAGASASSARASSRIVG
ncbi:hypothetical protein DP43_6604 [Burkholderia pseudomallei]|nr:hypothetical protein DP43_6604 [Burkholderia pseudomallei]